ncbi:ABC-2 type transport system ATP-binding protein [Oikeobacillus pervagus]|uniref:ABC-2 type transport system ATP-binding protein n=1 Tax=Oikeobacillus pervagus TaxID=1325931 RepID=A0AAJ1T1H9_9BACI|nr:ABC transporter ATP-binding protein [Oikeobacillus pervagus]MDQ0216629.1 ABC-2 type transport system ATP-binding protein [Oikeobacillus pervagus]
MISIQKVSKNYGRNHSLKEVSMEIPKGEIFGLLGPNGAGKSTLLSILATISKPSSGTITIKEFDLSLHKKIRPLIGYVPQEIALLDEATVKENMVFWSKFNQSQVSNEYLYDICERFHLANKWTEKVAHLSGGMKRKLNIATALIHQPEILLMDEPTVGIDLQSKMEINQYLKQLAEEGKTIVYTTHDLSEILYLCNRLGVLKNGRLVFEGTIDEAREKLYYEGSQLTDEEVIYHLLKN